MIRFLGDLLDHSEVDIGYAQVGNHKGDRPDVSYSSHVPGPETVEEELDEEEFEEGFHPSVRRPLVLSAQQTPGLRLLWPFHTAACPVLAYGKIHRKIHPERINY